MYCNRCGSKMNNGSQICEKCGWNVNDTDVFINNSANNNINFVDYNSENQSVNHNFNADSAEDKNIPVGNKKSKAVPIIGTIVIIVAVAVIICLVIKLSKQNSNNNSDNYTVKEDTFEDSATTDDQDDILPKATDSDGEGPTLFPGFSDEEETTDTTEETTELTTEDDTEEIGGTELPPIEDLEVYDTGEISNDFVKSVTTKYVFENIPQFSNQSENGKVSLSFEFIVELYGEYPKMFEQNKKQYKVGSKHPSGFVNPDNLIESQSEVVEVYDYGDDGFFVKLSVDVTDMGLIAYYLRYGDKIKDCDWDKWYNDYLTDEDRAVITRVNQAYDEVIKDDMYFLHGEPTYGVSI